MFNYGKYFYENKIFDVETKEDIKLMKKALNDIKKIEEYFSDKLPNLEAIKPVVAESFKFNKELNYKDRINYIIGIVYSKKYINIDDVYDFSLYLQNLVEPEDDNSIFYDKGFSNNTFGFFFDAFSEDMVTYKEYMDSIIEDEEEYDEEDEDENIINSNSNNATDLLDPEDDTSEEEFDEFYYDLSALEKIELFKDNFEEYIEIMLDRKCVNKRKNNRTRVYIIKGMRDYFDYIMGILEESYEINKIQRDYNSLNLSKFI